MSFNYRVERDDEEAHLFVTGSLAASDATALFDPIARLIDGGYQIHLHLEEIDFIGLGAVRALKTAALRAEAADVSLNLYAGSALYRAADLVGPERWSPLPFVSYEDDSVSV
jgi:hypothetical protein